MKFPVAVQSIESSEKAKRKNLSLYIIIRERKLENEQFFFAVRGVLSQKLNLVIRNSVKSENLTKASPGWLKINLQTAILQE